MHSLAKNQVKQNYEKQIAKVSEGGSTRGLKRLLWKLVQEKEDRRLLKSLYFDEIY